MSRPLRLEYPGSLWHITMRGNDRNRIYADDVDRRRFLALLAEAVRRFKWILTSYVLMSNHYHLVVELTETTLSRGMKWLNGGYTQWFNRRHERVGHLFQGRFKSFLIDKENYALEVLRYVVLNPVRAKILASPDEWEWSSHRAVMGVIEAPSWLATDEVLAHFGQQRDVARARYQRFVEDGIGSARRPWDDLVGQMYLGSQTWLEGVRERVEIKPRASEHSLSQRKPARPDMPAIVRAVAGALLIEADVVRHGRGGIPRMIAAWIGCYEGLLTNGQIAAGLRMRSEAQVMRMVRLCDQELSVKPELQECVDRCLDTLSRRKERRKT